MSSTVNPEDFLIPESEVLDHSALELEQDIKDLSSYADDVCSICKEAKCVCTKGLPEKGAKVLYGLGKLAAKLEMQNNKFASDIVQATAYKIKEDLLQKEIKKFYLIDKLTKIASEVASENDQFTADMIMSTVDKIKKY